jgi:hypothetical protein
MPRVCSFYCPFLPPPFDSTTADDPTNAPSFLYQSKHTGDSKSKLSPFHTATLWQNGPKLLVAEQCSITTRRKPSTHTSITGAGVDAPCPIVVVAVVVVVNDCPMIRVSIVELNAVVFFVVRTLWDRQHHIIMEEFERRHHGRIRTKAGIDQTKIPTDDGRALCWRLFSAAIAATTDAIPWHGYTFCNLL